MNILEIIEGIAKGTIKNDSLFINEEYGELIIYINELWFKYDQDEYPVKFYQILEMIENNVIWKRK